MNIMGFYKQKKMGWACVVYDNGNKQVICNGVCAWDVTPGRMTDLQPLSEEEAKTAIPLLIQNIRRTEETSFFPVDKELVEALSIFVEGGDAR